LRKEAGILRSVILGPRVELFPAGMWSVFS